MSDFEVDIPVTVSPEMAEDMAADLEERGRVTLTISRSDAPDIVNQIRWQLANEQPALEFVEDYGGNDE